mmetsp:Transcript_13508/g.47638  ORF Transcript_13508/g.47638 Transcript_13508/m.47638 type:complete len:148 (+) Transcript_13508:71-514(+)
MGQQLAAPACECDRRLCGIADDEPMVVVTGDLTMEMECSPDTGEAPCSRENKEASVTSASTADSRAADREREARRDAIAGAPSFWTSRATAASRRRWRCRRPQANGKTRADLMLHVISTRKIFDLTLRRDRDRASRTPRIDGSKADD